VGLVASADGETVLLEDVQVDGGDTLEKWDPDR
jgi:hypothetical protein